MGSHIISYQSLLLSTTVLNDTKIFQIERITVYAPRLNPKSGATQQLGSIAVNIFGNYTFPETSTEAQKEFEAEVVKSCQLNSSAGTRAKVSSFHLFFCMVVISFPQGCF